LTSCSGAGHIAFGRTDIFSARSTLMKTNRSLVTTALFALAVAGCKDGPSPTAPEASDARPEAAAVTAQQAVDGFQRASREVLALPQTVFAAPDPSGQGLVFGVEHGGVIPAVRNVLARLGIPESAYSVRVVEPFRFLSGTLQEQHRPTLGGIQIHFGMFICSLGFNADHSGGRSFVTASHCTDDQGTNTGTIYYQPTSSIDPSPIGVEADDPAYLKGLDNCSPGRRCRYSDAARVLYASGIGNNAEIAKTTGSNNGSIDVVGAFDVTSQDNTTTSFSGRLHKVGRTTGWTEGDADLTCANVNVLGSNIQLLCQTIVNAAAGSGDSGSPVFRTTGTSTAELVGIVWGGSSSSFVFSPLKNIQDELGSFDATTDGTGTGGGGGGGGNGGGGGGGGVCPPGNPGHPKCPA
jgi:hypothetical protein